MFIPPIGSSTTTTASTTAKRAGATLTKTILNLSENKFPTPIICDDIKKLNITDIEGALARLAKREGHEKPNIEDAITGLLRQERHDELEREATRAKLARQERLDRMNRKEAASS